MRKTTEATMQDFMAPLDWTGDEAQVLGLRYRIAQGQLWLGDQSLGPVADPAAARALAQTDLTARMLAAMTPAARAAVHGVARARHVKRGSHYRVLGQGRLQTGQPLGDDAALVIYRAEQGGALWARPVAEFEDGRFDIAPE
jgi:hypothetical protein